MKKNHLRLAVIIIGTALAAPAYARSASTATVSTTGENPELRMVGPEINVAPVAVMVQLNSPLRKKIDIALLALREDGSYQRLYDKWFGSP